MRKVLILLILFIVMLPLGCSKAEPELFNPSSDLVVLEDGALDDGQGNIWVYVRLVNRGEEDYSIVFLEIEFSDEYGQSIATQRVETSNLRAGHGYEFRVDIADISPAYYRIATIGGE